MLGAAGLLLLVSVLLYVPAVQKFAVGKIAVIVRNSTGMKLDVGRFRLRVPLMIELDDATLVTPAGDTIAAVGKLRADIAVWPLLAGEIRSPHISLENASSTYRDSLSTILVRARLAYLDVRGAGLKLNDNSLKLSRVTLHGVDSHLDLGERPPAETAPKTDTAAVPWSFAVRRLDMTDINFGMHTEPRVTELAVALPRGTIRRASVDLGKQDVSAAIVRLTGGDYSYLTDHGTAQPTAASEQKKKAGTPWTVGVGKVQLTDNSAAYGSLTGSPAAGFDPQHIRATGIGMLAENFSYRGGDINAGLRRLEFRERSGFRVMKGHGDFSMTGDGLSLEGFELATAGSAIGGTARVGAGITRAEPSTPIGANISATVDPEDIYIFVPVNATVRRSLAGRTLTLDGDFSGTLGDVSVNRLAATLPGHITFNARGDVRSIINPADLGGQIAFDGSLRDIGFLRGFIADTALRRRIGFPRSMTFSGESSFSPHAYELARFRLDADGGRLVANAGFDRRSEGYRAEIALEDFPLHAFLPHDSVGVATLNLDARGRGFDPVRNMDAGLALDVDRLEYRGYDYGTVTAKASVADGKIEGNIDSRSSALVFNLAIDGTVSAEKYAAHLTGDVGKADFYGMKLVSNALAVTTMLDMTVSAATDTVGMAYAFDAVFDSTIIHHGDNTERIHRTIVSAASGSSETSARIGSGDLKVDFMTPLPLDSLAARLKTVTSELTGQIGSRSLRMNSIRRALPDMKLTASAGQGNFFRDMLHAGGIDFRKLEVDISTVADNPLRAGVEINGFRSGTFALDTLNLWARQRGDSLRYALRLANRPGNMENLALIYVYGAVSENNASLNVLQRNRADSVGFRFGLRAQLLDSLVRATFTPANPILGYRQWSVNEDNYAEYHFDHSFYADLRLEGPDGNHVVLQSASLAGIPRGALRLDMAGIDIANILELFPTGPPLGGMLYSDLKFGLHEGTIAAAGKLGVTDFKYKKRRVADIEAGVDFQSSATGTMTLDAQIELDSKTALTAKGTYLTADKGHLDVTVDIPGIPLTIAGAFLPEGTATFDGNLGGKFTLTGPPSDIAISGDAGFTGGRTTIAMLGTTYGISEDRITVSGRTVDFNGFGIVAPNNRKLAVNGSLDIRDFSAPRADITLTANEFKAVNSNHIGGSQVFGSALLDMNVTARGPLRGLTVRGGVNLRSNTNVTYIIRNQSNRLADRRQNIVSFMVFADSLFMETYAPIENLRPASAVDMLVGVNIEDGLKANLFLDELGENRIELRGRGSLSYSMNSQGDTRLSGRYTLSGGTVYYKPPIIAQKVFAVQDGSYVEWTGDVADPSFNVRAVQTMRVDVTMGGSTRNETFEITISFEGSLNGMSVMFDVACLTNAAIQNDLLAMAPEQRMQQALTLLLNGQYTGPGASSRSSGLDARDQLNTFIAREVNQWARNNLRGVDFSLGIDTRDDESGIQHTNYSYSVSKRLFNDRVTVTVGGRVSDNATSQSLRDNLIDDITIEYRLTKRDNMFLKVYRLNTRQTLFEGEVTETGVGFLMRKKMNSLGDLFRLENNRERREIRRSKRENRHQLRLQERTEGIGGMVKPEDAPPPGATVNSTVSGIPDAPETPNTPDAPEHEVEKTEK